MPTNFNSLECLPSLKSLDSFVIEKGPKEAELRTKCGLLKILTQVPIIGSLVSLFVELPFKLISSFYRDDQLSAVASFEKKRNLGLVLINLVPVVGQIVNIVAINCFSASIKEDLFKTIENQDEKTFNSLLKSSKIPDSLVPKLFEKIQEVELSRSKEQKGITASSFTLYLFENASEEGKQQIVNALCKELSTLGKKVVMYFEQSQESDIQKDEDLSNLLGCQMTLCTLNLLTRADERLSLSQAELKHDANRYLLNIL